MKAQTLYRAVPADKMPYQAERGRAARDSVRLPTNIPYLADNLIEWLRPQHMPSRRHAIYASRTPELALAAAAADHRGSGYVACELVFHGDYKVAQLSVQDAKNHSDIVRFARLVQANAEMLMSDAGRAQTAALFLPGSTAAQIETCVAESRIAFDFAARAREMSTFWQDAQAKHPDDSGELFLQMAPDARYELRLPK